MLVLLSHLQLQKKGFLSTWTDSFVGPWDPSQDEKIKLWLFLPGRHSSVVETPQSAVFRLKGTAESRILIFSAPDYGDVGTSPVRMMDLSDQMLLPGGIPSVESFDPPPVAQEEYLGNTKDVTKNSISLGLGSHTPASSTCEFNHIIKAEALMTFTSEYEAMETPTNEKTSMPMISILFAGRKDTDAVIHSENNYTHVRECKRAI